MTRRKMGAFHRERSGNRHCAIWSRYFDCRHMCSAWRLPRRWHHWAGKTDVHCSPGSLQAPAGSSCCTLDRGHLFDTNDHGRFRGDLGPGRGPHLEHHRAPTQRGPVRRETCGVCRLGEERWKIQRNPRNNCGGNLLGSVIESGEMTLAYLVFDDHLSDHVRHGCRDQRIWRGRRLSDRRGRDNSLGRGVNGLLDGVYNSRRRHTYHHGDDWGGRLDVPTTSL